MSATAFVGKPVSEFTSERIHKCATIEIAGTIDKVFPLFGPVREKEWAFGWEPEIIYSTTNLVEEHMIFRTKASHTAEEFYQWVITQFQPSAYQIEYTVSTPNRIWFIRVACASAGSHTQATICYSYTGLNALGNQLNREALNKMYVHDLTDWEKAINHYLKHGTQLID
jgi:hypothetical protein